jgi:hypothetical protein
MSLVDGAQKDSKSKRTNPPSSLQGTRSQRYNYGNKRTAAAALGVLALGSLVLDVPAPVAYLYVEA